MWASVAFLGTSALFLTMSAASLAHLRRARRLPALSALTPGHPGDAASQVRCSVVMAARDEEARIEGAVRRLLAQSGVAVDVIVVDDRSTDGTGAILQRLGRDDGRLQVIRINELPDGWLGKSHACHVGAGAATGEWILFTDADCWLKPDVVARALQVAGREDADHVTLTPGVAPATTAAKAWHLALLTRLAGRIAGVNRDRAGAHFGIGAFNLVRASAYRDCGGYEALRLTIVDDVKLGLLLHRAGKRTRAFIGGDDAECHWGTTVPGMIRIMEKNYFAAADYRVGPVVAMGVMAVLLFGAALIGPWTGTSAGYLAALAPWSLTVPALVVAERVGWPRGPALLAPVMFPVIVYAVLNSAIVTLRQGGVRWRTSFYALETLRQGTVR